MDAATLELIDKINQAGKSVLVVQLQAESPDDNAQQAAAKRAAYIVRNWQPPAAHAAALFVTGQPLVAGMHALLERTRTGGLHAQNDFAQALDVLPVRRRQFSPDHRWTLYDAHPAQ